MRSCLYALEVRPFVAAKLYSERLVTKVLVSQVKRDRTSEIEVISDHTEVNRAVL